MSDDPEAEADLGTSPALEPEPVPEPEPPAPEPEPEPEFEGNEPMASGETIDLQALLTPISGENPSGQDLSYAPDYDIIREARKEDPSDLPMGEWQRDPKVADWPKVIQTSTACLSGKTKDLQIAAWLTEALTKVRNFAGLRDGLRLMLGIQRRYWETYYPRIDEGDLESREGPFLLLNDPRVLPRIVRSVPLTDAEERYDFFRYEESRKVDNQIRNDPESQKKLLSEGKITGEQFDKQVAQTPRRFYETIVADLRLAHLAFNALEADTDERFGRDAPSLINLREALADCLRLLETILKKKRESEPDAAIDAMLAGPAAAPSESAPDSGEPADEAEPNRSSGGGGTTIQLGPAPQAAEFGKILIEFLPRARALNELGEKLEANRREYNELLAQLKALDQDYEQLSRQFSQSQEAYQLLGRLLKIPSWAPPPPSTAGG
jgi:type VI secretion system protein ImpA